jgi:hypothetical protein
MYDIQDMAQDNAIAALESFQASRHQKEELFASGLASLSLADELVVAALSLRNELNR